MRSRSALLLVALAFVLSGFSGLVYEIVWMQLLVNVFGVTYFAIVTIVTSFMAGMALGALVSGRITDRGVPPLALYLGLELFVGVFALSFPWIADQLFHGYPVVYARLQLGFFSASLLRFAVCFVILLLPATAMGATLPVLTKYIVRSRERIGADVGLLYGLNTLGAAVGCVLTGYWLSWALGLRVTNGIAVASTLTAAGIAAWLLLTRADRDLPSPSPAPPTPSPHAIAGRALLVLFFLSGFTSMAYELLWTRVFTMFHTNPQTAVFSLILFLYLLGLGTGSALYPRIRLRRDPLALFGLIQVSVAALVATSLVLFGAWAALAPSTRPSMLGSGFGTGLFHLLGVTFFPAELLLAVVVVFIPGLLFGLTFPLANALYVRDLPRLGTGVGGVYFAITVGGIAGSFVSGFFLMPILSVKNALLVMVALNLAAGAWVLATRFRPEPGSPAQRWATLGILAVVAAILGLGVATPPWVFMPRDEGDRVLFFADGRNVSSGVIEKLREGDRPQRLVYTSGERVSGWMGDIDLPLMISPRPSSVLTVAFGAGGSAARASKHPGVESVTSVDLDDNQHTMAAFFEWNQDLLAWPGFRLEANDGRNFLYTSQDRYDLIFNDPGTYTLYRELGTREYLGICRDRLGPDGLLFQKAHTEIITLEAFRREVATFAAVFPDASLWSAGRSMFILVGWSRGAERDYRALQRRAGQAGRQGGDESLTATQVAARFFLDHDELLALAGEAEPFLDDRIPPMNDLFVLPDVTDLSPRAVEIRRRNATAILEAILAADTSDAEFFSGISSDEAEQIRARRAQDLEGIRSFLTYGDAPAPGGR